MTSHWTWKSVLSWLALNVAIVICMQFALFSQTTGDLKTAPYWQKTVSSEFWALVEYAFIIPAQRIGNTFLSSPQLALSSYVFNFLSQIGSNMFWLNKPTTIDDVVGMVMFLFGMYASKVVLFG